MSVKSRTRLLQRLKRARHEAKIKQEQVARYLGVSPSTISAIENGSRKLDALELLALAKLYNHSVAWFLADYSAEWPETSLAVEKLEPMVNESLVRVSKLPLAQQRKVAFQLLSWLDEEPG